MRRGKKDEIVVVLGSKVRWKRRIKYRGFVLEEVLICVCMGSCPRDQEVGTVVSALF